MAESPRSEHEGAELRAVRPYLIVGDADGASTTVDTEALRADVATRAARLARG